MPSNALRVERREQDELTCWQIRVGDGELLVAEQGAQVLRYGQRGEQPLIWLSEQAAYRAGQPLRGGVPVCWPWFGDLGRNPESVRAQHGAPDTAPFHGLVRSLPWQLREIAQQDGAVTLSFTLAVDHEGLDAWPHQVEPTLRLRLDGRLSVTLESHNRSDHPVMLSQALHTYLAVGDIHQASLPALDGCRYVDSLDHWREHHQEGALRFTGETDRLYLHTPKRIELHDPAWGRRVCLESLGSRSAIVWNPWIDKARRLSQFADDAWQRMLCIETANVLDDVRELAAGECSELGVTLWSEPLRQPA